MHRTFLRWWPYATRDRTTQIDRAFPQIMNEITHQKKHFLYPITQIHKANCLAQRLAHFFFLSTHHPVKLHTNVCVPQSLNSYQRNQATQEIINTIQKISDTGLIKTKNHYKVPNTCWYNLEKKNMMEEGRGMGGWGGGESGVGVGGGCGCFARKTK